MDAIRPRLEWVVGAAVQSALDSDAINLTRARQRKAAQGSVEFIERYMPDVKCFADRLELLGFRIQSTTVKGLYCEFGVYKGETINFIAGKTQNVVHGFDSFEGLPEFWKNDVDKGAFRVDKPPAVKQNVRLHRGWFSETLPTFMSEYSEPVSFLHIDADLYSSTKTIFDLMASRIVTGTIIQFDEFFNYPGWEQGEYRAFQEFVDSAGIQVQYIGHTAFRQVAVKVSRAEGLDSGPRSPRH